MGSVTDKIKGAFDKAVGKGKEKIGLAVGSDNLQAKGIALNIKGHAETGIAKQRTA